MIWSRIKIIGLGGVGSLLCDNLCRYLNYQKGGEFIVTLIDGDDYEYKNNERQSFSRLGSKATVKANDMRTMFDNISFRETPVFITPENISRYIAEGDIIFLCVDNHKTRKLVSDYAGTVNDLLIISGGNEYTDGNVQIYLRIGGEDKTPSLTDYHPEIVNAGDKSPDEMSCEELAEVEPQLLFTNMTVATIMCWTYYNISSAMNENLDYYNSEVYFDIQTMYTSPKVRQPKNRKKENKKDGN
jgi:molybdopterin/thiamine biosynthesis adenylyltransferase